MDQNCIKIRKKIRPIHLQKWAHTLFCSKSQHFTILSSPHEKRYGCLALTATPLTVLTWPVKVSLRVPEAKSQIWWFGRNRVESVSISDINDNGLFIQQHSHIASIAFPSLNSVKNFQLNKNKTFQGKSSFLQRESIQYIFFITSYPDLGIMPSLFTNAQIIHR